ncbi:MAG: alpha/beta hydrolase [Prosthecobacter sp.]|nr:alpha/beta hydrolase [Prosthecobacter sp.]
MYGEAYGRIRTYSWQFPSPAWWVQGPHDEWASRDEPSEQFESEAVFRLPGNTNLTQWAEKHTTPIPEFKFSISRFESFGDPDRPDVSFGRGEEWVTFGYTNRQGIPRYLAESVEKYYYSTQETSFLVDINQRGGHTIYYETNGASWKVASAASPTDEQGSSEVYIDPEEADPRRIAHHITIRAEGPASYPANWTPPEPQLTNAPWIALAQMGAEHIIPFSPYHVPAKTTMVAASTSQMQRNLEEGVNPDDILEGTYSGVYEHGNVSIQWRDNWPVELTDETKKSWISRYLVMKKVILQVGDGELQETTTIKPLSDYVGETFSEKTLLENVDAGAPEIGITKTVVLSLMAVGLAIDANRDGTIANGEAASQEKPFRFWINEDNDGTHVNGFIEPIGGDPDYQNRYISNTRDLEDFTLIKLSGLSPDLPVQRIGFTLTGGGRINLYRCPDSITSTNQFVSSDSFADSIVHPSSNAYQNANRYTECWLSVDNGNCWFPSIDRPEENCHLLLEGAATGNGMLTLIMEVDGEVVRGPSIWLKLMHASEMIHRAYATYNGGIEPTDIPDAWDNPTPDAMGWKLDPYYTFSKAPDETDECVIHVHGWRMSDAEARNWSEMSFKRLWHLGYKGRVASFRWPTYSGEYAGYLSYNSSEYRALLSGPTLAAFVNSLPFSSNNRKLFAHSMGNVVAGSALRAGLSINGGYVMQHAAMAAMAYDGSGNVEVWDRHTPDDDVFAENRDLGLRNKFNFASPQIYNFCLPADSALASWLDNQTFAKPQPFTLTSYYYDRFRSGMNHHLFYGVNGIGGPFGSGRDVTKLAEALAYVTQSRSNAAGATLATEGCIDSTVNLNNEFEFADEHSAEWNRRIQLVYSYWRRLAITLNLEINGEEAP